MADCAVGTYNSVQLPAADFLQQVPQDILRAFRPDVIFEVEATDSPNVSAVTTEVDGRTFQNVGADADHAKQLTAIEVLKYLYTTNQITVPEEQVKFLMSWQPKLPDNERSPNIPPREGDIPNISPLMYLNQITAKNPPQWEVIQVSAVPSRFKAIVTMSDRAYEGTESTKKLAKQKAADAALRGQFGIDWSELRVPQVARKRSLEDVDLQDSSSQGNSDADGTSSSTPSKRKRKQADNGTPTFSKNKNPLQILNEFRRGTIFNLVSQEGPSHAPTITMSTEIDGRSFQCQATSKQKAKFLLATDIVQHFVEKGQLALVETPDGSDSDTSRVSVAQQRLQTQTVNSPAKTPLMMLYELTRDQPVCEVSEFEENKTKRFVASYSINGQTFRGEGLSKQRAKHRAAEKILRDMFGVTPSAIKAAGGDGSGSDTGNQSASNDLRYLQFADRVRRKVTDQWRCLGEKALSEENAKRKVLAGIVLTRDAAASADDEVKGEGDSNDSTPSMPLFDMEEVLCLSTGTKCLSGEFLNSQGTALNDCHAEVLSTRCLRLMLFSDIEKILAGEESTLLERSESNGRFRLKPGHRLHLYISTSPCGDGRIFCPHELGDLSSDTHPGRRSRGLLRTKIESGEGTIPVMTNGTGLQTFDGVIQGERLLTMSCSDKLCMWSAIGVQGSLLSLLLEKPIFYDSVVIGSVFAESHVERALYGRIAGLKEPLPEPYELFRPKFIATTERDERQPRKSPNISVNWINAFDTETAEVVIAPRGKQEGDVPSRLCKQNLFASFCRIKQRVPWLAELCVQPKEEATGEPLPLLYAEAKQRAQDYFTAKRLIQKHFKVAGLGSWTRRPIEQDLFELVE